jgi:hypothetical protein
MENLPEMAIELKARLAADEHLIIDRQIVLSGAVGTGRVDSRGETCPT